MLNFLFVRVLYQFQKLIHTKKNIMKGEKARNKKKEGSLLKRYTSKILSIWNERRKRRNRERES